VYCATDDVVNIGCGQQAGACMESHDDKIWYWYSLAPRVVLNKGLFNGLLLLLLSVPVLLVYCDMLTNSGSLSVPVPWLNTRSVLWHCWLGRRKGIQPVKTEWWGIGVVIYLEWGANDLHLVKLLPLQPRHLAAVKSGIIYLSDAGLSRLSWKKAVKRM